MLLVLGGTKKGESVHILATEWNDNPFVQMKSSTFKGRVVEVIHAEKEYDGDVTNQFNVRFEARGVSHYFMMKGNAMALSVVNSLASATTQELENVEFSFYVNKEGFNSVSVKAATGGMIDKPNGDQVPEFKRLDWFITKEEKDSLTRKYQGKGGKEEKDDAEYVKKLISLIPDINAKCPARLVTGSGADLFDEVMDYSKAEPRQTAKDVSDEAEEYLNNAWLGTPTPATTTKAQPDNGDIPFI